MASRTTQNVQVGKRKLELSNLQKVLFPEDQISKAQLIEYYLTLAPTILTHLKGRPLSVVRFPDGLGGEKFFQKEKPKFAPDWIDSVVLGGEEKDYVIATEEATLVFLANLACIELHQMQVRAPNFDKPDYIVYDFDPPDNFVFSDIIDLTFQFKSHLESFGYAPFVKTTGRKGLHILTPIEPNWPADKVFEAAKLIAEPFVAAHSNLTLQLKKDLRKGRILLDIYRNRTSQTIVAAYSVRGSIGAPISTPIAWEELESLESSVAYNIHNIRERIAEVGDPWQAFAASATAIHTDPKPIKVKKLPAARTRKTPEQLEEYSNKRSFDKTTEPPPGGITAEGRTARAASSRPAASGPSPSAPNATIAIGRGSAFVVHRHHATRVHYDLRLEKNGVLKSWAVPKGLPPRPGIKRLAIAVEDHPLDYVNFEGEIPKGEYGGGMMWKFAQGRYEITKQKEDGMYFRLNSRELTAEFRMHNTNANQWLLERVDNPQTDWLRARIDPMLAKAAAEPPTSADYLYEVKWDGIRAVVSLDEGQIKIHGRNGLDITNQFPELLDAENSFRAFNGVFDGEIVCLQSDGKPDFANVIHRMQQRSDGGIKLARGRCPAVCYLFDCLYLDGRRIMNEPLTRRRAWLQDAIKKGTSYRLSEAVDDGAALYEAVKGMSLEGIMAKQRHSPYLPGKRADSWLKIKSRTTVECIIIGYSKGKGDRASTFGALHLAEHNGTELIYIGKAGSGFDVATQKSIFAELSKLQKIKRPVKERPDDDSVSIYLEPKLICEVSFATKTKDGILREPVFLRLRPDLTA